MHGLALTPRQWTVIRHVLIAAGEQDDDIRWQSGPIVRALGQNLAHWTDDSDDDESLLVTPEYVQLIGETLAAYQEGRVTVPDATTLDKRAIDPDTPVTAEHVEQTLTRSANRQRLCLRAIPRGILRVRLNIRRSGGDKPIRYHIKRVRRVYDNSDATLIFGCLVRCLRDRDVGTHPVGIDYLQ
jgi:hypothetical protein